MDRETKTKWIEALRSGDYRQGEGHLKFNDEVYPSYCCLGVLCDVLDPAGWEYRPGFDGFTHTFGAKRGDLVGGYVSTRLLSKKTQDTLINFNDSEERDFNFIADYIEHNVNVSR